MAVAAQYSPKKLSIPFRKSTDDLGLLQSIEINREVKGLRTHVKATLMEESDIQDNQRQLSNLSVRKRELWSVWLRCATYQAIRNSRCEALQTPSPEMRAETSR
jgi:hypothetical protein